MQLTLTKLYAFVHACGMENDDDDNDPKVEKKIKFCKLRGHKPQCLK